ncbi:MAG: hypothetical protein HY918_05595 [Candidatus Doudnabacteria bacterium]|nr:hypothetical protein [Candidatus Doudnabacteria bacterium]
MIGEFDGTIQQRISKAFCAYGSNNDDKTLKALVEETSNIFGWEAEKRGPRQKELLWECGIASGLSILTLSLFMQLAFCENERSCIPLRFGAPRQKVAA